MSFRTAAHGLYQRRPFLRSEDGAPALKKSEIGRDDASLAREEEGKHEKERVPVRSGE